MVTLACGTGRLSFNSIVKREGLFNNLLQLYGGLSEGALSEGASEDITVTCNDAHHMTTVILRTSVLAVAPTSKLSFVQVYFPNRSEQ